MLFYCSCKVQMPVSNQQMALPQTGEAPPSSKVVIIICISPEAEWRVERANTLKVRHRHLSALSHMVPLTDLEYGDPARPLGWRGVKHTKWRTKLLVFPPGLLSSAHSGLVEISINSSILVQVFKTQIYIRFIS